MEINDIKKDFVERTLKLLETQNNLKFDTTFLLNCLLGLLVAVYEFEDEDKKESIFNKNINQEFLEYIPDNIEYFKAKDDFEKVSNRLKVKRYNIELKGKNSIQEKTQLWYLEKIRNSIAHININPINRDKKWASVELFNEHSYGKDFSVEYSNEDLKKFAVYIAKRYLNILSR